jgi:hypothetical protein
MNKIIEIEVKGHEGKLVKYSFSKENVSHWRQYTTSPTQGKGDILTMLFLKDNPKGIVLNCGYDTFKRKMETPMIDVSGLSDDNISKVYDLIQSFRKIEDLK